METEQIKRGQQPPIVVPLGEPIESMGRTLHEVTIKRRMNGYDVLAECDVSSNEEVQLLRVQRLCDLAPPSEESLLAPDVRRIHGLILGMEADIEPATFPYRLRFPVAGLTEIQAPRKATGKDMIHVGREGNGNAELKVLLYAETLCGLTREQFGAMDGEDVQALALGCIPFWLGSPDPKPAAESSPASP